MTKPQVHILTLFPEFFEGPLRVSLLGKGIDRGLLEVHCHDLRDQAEDRHRTVDDTPFGGGSGMVIRPDIAVKALEALPGGAGPDRPHRIAMNPAGVPLTQEHLERWAVLPQLAILCGRYEGIDGRVGAHFIDEEISLGDFVLSGGEVAALTIVEALSRLIPGVLGNQDSLGTESFNDGLLEAPQYTRPRSFRGHDVPEVLLSGDHARVDRWRHEMAKERTRQLRPDLWAKWDGKNDDDAP
jgi:tRNA (guanine37-N1)-methyltransferase